MFLVKIEVDFKNLSNELLFSRSLTVGIWLVRVVHVLDLKFAKTVFFLYFYKDMLRATFPGNGLYTKHFVRSHQNYSLFWFPLYQIIIHTVILLVYQPKHPNSPFKGRWGRALELFHV